MYNTKDRARAKVASGNHSRHVPPGALPSPSRHNHRHKSKSPHANSRNVQVNNATNNHNRGLRLSSTLPNPEIPHTPLAKVRVQAGAGDKCVAPVKSKQKRRQAVPGRPIDESTLSMDAVTWSDEVYTVDQLVHAYGGNLPVIVKVMRGCHNNTGFDLNVNQVIQCHSFARQKRVRAHLDSGGKICIPAEYPMQLYIKENNREERLRLSQALDRMVLPQKSLVTSVDEDIDVTTVDVLGCNLTLREIRQEVFVRANKIHDGWIDQEELFAIPASFDATFSVAVGMRGATMDEWMDYQGMFSRSVRHLHFQLLTGFDGIIIEDDAGGTIQVMQPKDPILKRLTDGPVYENMGRSYSEKRPSTIDARPSTSRLAHSYENWDQPVMLRSKSEKQRGNRPRTMDFEENKITYSRESSDHSSQQESQDGTKPESAPFEANKGTGFDVPLPDVVVRQQQPIVMSSPSHRPSTPFSEVDEDDVEEMFKSVLDVAAEQENEKKRREDEKRLQDQEQLFVQRRREEERRKDEIRKRVEQRELQRISSTGDQRVNNMNHPDSAKEHLQARNVLNKNNLGKDGGGESKEGKILEVNRPCYLSSSSSVSDKVQIGAIELEVYNVPGSRSSTHVSTRDKGVKTLTKRFEIPEDIAVNVNNNFEQKQSPQPTVNTTISAPHVVKINVFDSPARVVVNGYPQSSDNSHESKPHESSVTCNSIEDVPKDVSILNVDDVCKCLSLLDMDKHIGQFKSRQINGKLLLNMRENDMIKDFNFTPFNASKLTRFVRGWRPKSA